jgi:hypothetical protein
VPSQRASAATPRSRAEGGRKSPALYRPGTCRCVTRCPCCRTLKKKPPVRCTPNKRNTTPRPPFHTR